MVEAARSQDWDRLVRLERQVTSLRSALMKEEEGSLSPPETERKRALIQHILDDDAEIRRHTEPWMEQLRQFLGDASRRKRVERTYGSST